MKVLVCGGRDFNNPDLLNDTLNEQHAINPFTLLIHGDAKGADYWAKCWANARGIQCAAFAAPWLKHGKKAGPMRNSAMIAAIRPELVIAFPGGSGTSDMARKAEAIGVPVFRVKALEPAT